MSTCSLCGIEYDFDTNGTTHFHIPCARCQADHDCVVCGEPVGLYCFGINDQDPNHQYYIVTIAHTGSNNPPPPCQYLSHPDTDWLPAVQVWEPVGHLTGPADGKHQYIAFLDRWNVEDISENGDEPKSRSLMQWSSRHQMPCHTGEDRAWRARFSHPIPKRSG